MSLSQDLDCIAHDPCSEVTLTFTTPADALIARLRLEAALGSTVVDLFLQTIQCPAIGSVELTIRSVSDIDAAVAGHRQELRLARSVLPTSGRTPWLIPYPILECILNHIATDPELVDEPLYHQLPATDHVEVQRADCFRACSLVHRSWTVPSQQLLVGRLLVRSPQEIIRLLRNPLPGRHTRELFVSLGTYFSMRYQGNHQEPLTFQDSDIENDLVSLLKRLPSLRHFSIKEYGLDESVLFPALTSLVELESLSWQCNYGYPGREFLGFIHVLGHLPKLSSLQLSGWNFRGVSSDTSSPLKQHFKHLHVNFTADEQTNNIGYLLQSLPTDSNSTLVLDSTLFSSLSVSAVLQAFPSTLNALSNLHTLHIINKGNFVGYNLQQFQTLIATCSSLRSLHIQSQTAMIGEFLDVLPNSLEELRFSWFDMWLSPWLLLESHLLSLLQDENRVPKLRKVVVHNYDVAFDRFPLDDNGLMEDHPCPKTQEACDDRNIILDLLSKPPYWRTIDM